MLGTSKVYGGFSVDDIEKAEEFYSKTLGLESVTEPMGLRYKLPGGGEVFIYQKDDHKPASYTTLNIQVDDIDAAVDELTATGITMERYEQSA